MQFSDLNLIEPLLRAVTAEGYTEPTPVQAAAIPHVLSGRDLLGIAQTGTGKTAAFALPILQRLEAATANSGHFRRHIRVLVLTPTRELASQIGDSFKTYGKFLHLRHTVVFGGVGIGPQRHALADGIDILVATPGRLLDLMGQRCVHLERLEIFVLDEADRMLDMGFLPAVRRVIQQLPRKRQTLFFSATMPPDAQKLADGLLHGAARVEVAPPATTAEKVSQSLYHVEKGDKQALLEHLLDDPKITRALVFTRTKHGANKVVQRLEHAGYDADAIHANKSQKQRERALAAFKSGMSRVLVATDIAARGIDVEGISHVINFDLPNVPESYVHRIGRTARAGAEGAAISFCDHEERSYVKGIEREIRMKITVVEDHPFRRGHSRGHGPTAVGHPAHAAAAPADPHWLDGSGQAPPPGTHPASDATPAATPRPAHAPVHRKPRPHATPHAEPRAAERPASPYGRPGRNDGRPYRGPSVGARTPRSPAHRGDARRTTGGGYGGPRRDSGPSSGGGYRGASGGGPRGGQGGGPLGGPPRRRDDRPPGGPPRGDSRPR